MGIGMNKSCEHCQYNGPYWSIINHCENCPNNQFPINKTVTVATTTTTTDTDTLQIKYNENIGDTFVTESDTTPPSADEYRESIGMPYYPPEWSEPKYICPKCGGGMCRNEMVVLTSYPPQYEYSCNKCGYVEYQFG